MIGLLLACLASASPGDAHLEVLGFAPDGRYFLFEEYGVEAGEPFAHLYLVEVDSNTWVGEPSRVRGDHESLGGATDAFALGERLLQVRQRAWTRARKQYGRLQLPGFASGMPLVIKRGPRLVTEGPGHVHAKMSFTAKVKPSDKRKIDVDLILTNTTPDAEMAADCRPFALELRVTDTASKKTATWQKDSEPPRWRACVFDVALRSAWSQSDRVALVLRVDVPNDTMAPVARYMVVTGRLP
jgi:predicted secreted protein